MVLCRTCGDVFQCKSGERRIHDTSSIDVFLDSVDVGCCICSGLYKQMPKDLQELVREEAGRSTHPRMEFDRLLDGQPDKANYISTKLCYDGEESLSVASELQLQIPSESDVVSFKRSLVDELKLWPVGPDSKNSRRPATSWSMSSDSTDSEETFSKIADWITACDTTHAACRSFTNKTYWYPTRLVDITPWLEAGGEAQHLACRIALGKDIPRPGPGYITLSHRWADSDILKLTTDNLKDWMARIPVESLSPEFRDALFVAKRFGIRYVWIDSLCIVQDGDAKADWLREAPRMCDVYSTAVFNIAASWGREIGGLFSRREFDTVDILCDDAEVRRFLVFPRGCNPISERTPHNVWRENAEESPLNRRGWVFQERFLSRRNVYFCRGEVFFDCSEMRAGEAFGLSSQYWDSNYKSQKSLALCRGDKDRIYSLWDDVVRDYTATELTEASDRLIAISGVAQRIKALVDGDLFIAGLWLSRLSMDLLWADLSPAPKPSTGPSFLWISIEKAGSVRPFLAVLDLATRADGVPWSEAAHEPTKGILVSTKCIKYRNDSQNIGKHRVFYEDIFVMPSGPKIEIKVHGSLRRLVFGSRLQFGFCGPFQILALPHGLDVAHLMANEEGSDSFIGGMTRLEMEYGETLLDFQADSALVASLNAGGNIFYMPWYHAPMVGRKHGHLICMLLQLVDGRSARCRRIGIHSMDINPSSKADQYLAPPGAGEEELISGWFNDRTGKHTIYLV